LAADSGSAYAKAARYGEQIRAELTDNKADLLVLEREFQTQSVDPMFLEPECGLAWHDTGRNTLELVVGVQSPYEAAESVAYLLGEAHAPFKPARIDAQFAYIGGGFGGRDHTPFPLYVARWQRCSFRAVRFGSPTIAISSSRLESNGTDSISARASESIARPAGLAHSLPTTSWMAAGSPISRRV
jgi:CO/xanthine dehydrogenase Mo-binding subunit